MTTALEGGEWSAARHSCTLPPGKTWYQFYRRLGGPQGRSGWAENLVSTRIRPRTIQPVVSHYTDWATRPTNMLYYTLIFTSMRKHILSIVNLLVYYISVNILFCTDMEHKSSQKAPFTFVMSVHATVNWLPMYPNVSTQLTLVRFLDMWYWRLLLKICWENLNLVKIGGKYWTLYMKTYIYWYCWQW